MKRITFGLALALSLLVPTFAKAQVPPENRIYYVEMVADVRSILKTDAGIISETITFVTSSGRKASLVDAENKKIKFDNVIMALNYMGRYGWELVEVIPTFTETNPGRVNSARRHTNSIYLLKFDASKHPRNAFLDLLDKEIDEMQVYDSDTKGLSPITWSK